MRLPDDRRLGGRKREAASFNSLNSTVFNHCLFSFVHSLFHWASGTCRASFDRWPRSSTTEVIQFSLEKPKICIQSDTEEE